MADLTKDAYIKIWGEAYTDTWTIDTTAARVIYKGQPIILDINVDTVNVVQFVDSVVVAADDIFIGIAAAGASVAASAAETTEVTVYMEPTIVGIPGATVTDADVGDLVYMSDSATLSVVTAADNPMLGKLFRVKDGFQYVQLSSPTVCTGA